METLMRVWYLWIYLTILLVWPCLTRICLTRISNTWRVSVLFWPFPAKKKHLGALLETPIPIGSMYMVTWIPSINIPLMLAFFYQHHGGRDPMGYWATIATKLPPSICPIPSPTGALSATSNARRDGDGEAGLRVVEEVEGWKAKGCFGDKMSWIQVLYIIILYYIQMIYIVLFYIIIYYIHMILNYILSW